MASLKEEATNYKPKETKNIADLDKVPVSVELLDGNGTDKKTGKPFTYKYFVLNEDEYRVPASVLSQIQLLLSANPKLEYVRVRASGSGLNTKYKVEPVLG